MSNQIRMIKVPIANTIEFYAVRDHLRSLGFVGIELMFYEDEDFGFMILRNKNFISGNLKRAIHDVDEDIPITPGRFMKLSHLQAHTILDTENFIDS